MNLTFLNILALLLLTCQSKGDTSFDRFLKKKSNLCDVKQCIHLPKNNKEYCLNQCVNISCFTQYYSGDLEDGESDYQRQNLYKQCVKNIYNNCIRKEQISRVENQQDRIRDLECDFIVTHLDTLYH